MNHLLYLFGANGAMEHWINSELLIPPVAIVRKSPNKVTITTNYMHIEARVARTSAGIDDFRGMEPHMVFAHESFFKVCPKARLILDMLRYRVR